MLHVKNRCAKMETLLREDLRVEMMTRPFKSLALVMLRYDPIMFQGFGAS